jgi:ABC-type transport system involved in multi-copper enzyme maturation permease subunit
VIRFAWRQFRTQAAVAFAALAALAILLAITGAQLEHLYDLSGISACKQSSNCDPLKSTYLSHDKLLQNLLGPLLLAVPALLGIFWGAPLIASELETGTYQLAWTQSVTRTRWFTVKLTLIGLASIAVAGLCSLMITWWSGPFDHVKGSRFAAMTFATRDIVPLGYAAFAFALGTTAGLLLRRTIPAMALTLALFIGIQILVATTIRPNLLPSTTVTFPVNKATASQATGIYTTGGGAELHFNLPVPQGAWVISAPPVKNSSNHVVAARHSNCLFAPSASPTKGGAPDSERIAACLTRYHLHESVTYQPASHYWPLQWYETGIFLALAAALSGTSFWWTRRRLT